MQQHSKSKVCYYYDSDIGNYYYGQVRWLPYLIDKNISQVNMSNLQ